MAFDFGAGLSALGGTVAKYAGEVSLEMQKAALEEQKLKLADVMAGARQEKQNQFELDRDKAKLMEAYRLQRQGIKEDFDTAKTVFPGMFGGASSPAAGDGTPPTAGDGKPNPNNIGNVREVGKASFLQPASFEEGVNIAVNNVRAYPKAFNDGKPMTLTQIAEKWAPKGDGANDPKAWASNVSQYSGLDPNKPLDLNDPATAAAFARGAHAAEWGAKALKPAGDYVSALENAPPKGAPNAAPPSLSMPSMPPATNPYRYAPAALFPALKPYGAALTEADKAANADAWKRYEASVTELKTRGELANQPVTPSGQVNQSVVAAANAKAEGAARVTGELANRAVNPEGSVNQSVIDAATAKAAGEEKGKAQARNDYIFPEGLKDKPVAEKLAILPRTEREILEGLHDGTYGLSDLQGLRSAAGLEANKTDFLALGRAVYGKDWDPRLGDNRKEFVTYMRPDQKGGATVMAIANAAQHLVDGADAYNQLNNGQFPKANKWFNDLATQNGWDKQTSFEAIKQAIGTEVAKVVSGGTDNSVTERDANRDILANWNSPDAMSGVFKRFGGLIEKRRNTLYDQASRVKLGNDFVDQSIGESGTTALKAIPDAILPKRALSALKDGSVVTFSNGQRWTLQDGVPTRVP